MATITPQSNSKRITRRMARLNNHKQSELRKKPTSQLSQKCSICLHDIPFTEEVTLPCMHTFCRSCIADWWNYNSTCPFCRKVFNQIFDKKGNQLHKEETINNYASRNFEEQKSLRCQSCWADIGDEPMRICFQCRCIYVHRRCLTPQQNKSVHFYCDECWEQIERVSDKGEKQEEYKARTKDLTEQKNQRTKRSDYNRYSTRRKEMNEDIDFQNN